MIPSPAPNPRPLRLRRGRRTTEPADTDTTEPAGTEPAGDNPFGGTLAEGEFGESYLPDPALLEQALGGAASLPDDDMQRNIALAGVAGRRSRSTRTWRSSAGRTTAATPAPAAS